jgi:hypothetical protein
MVLKKGLNLKEMWHIIGADKNLLVYKEPKKFLERYIFS